jgi:hypothetical protein
MKFMKYKIWMFAGAMMVSVVGTHAGNEDRAGSAGSMDLLINPWARSSGWHGANTAIGRGLESQFLNVAGMAFTERTEILFAHTRWLAGTDIGINTFGFSQNLGKKRGVLGLSVMSLGSGAIEETTVNSPEGTGNTYQVNNLNIAASYARGFSDKIYGGFTIRLMTQSISNIAATGFTIDAGIMYKTTLGRRELNKDNLHFGITLKNIGPRMMATGDGLTVYNISPINGAVLTQQQRSAEFELPALMNIGIAYVYRFTKKHGLTTAFNFTTHSFTRDQFILGLEYNFNDMLMLRGGYAFEEGIFGERDGVNPNLLNAFTGPSGGFTFEAPFKKNGRTKIGLDYSFRATYTFAGVHTFGVRLLL